MFYIFLQSDFLVVFFWEHINIQSSRPWVIEFPAQERMNKERIERKKEKNNMMGLEVNEMTHMPHPMLNDQIIAYQYTTV